MTQVRGLRPRVAALAKWILPAGLTHWIRSRRQPSRSLWKGIHDHFRDVPREGPAYEGDEWILGRAAATTDLKRRVYGSPELAPAIDSRYLLLPACIATLRAAHRPIRILDFGGALGVGYLHLRATAGPLDDCDYYVVDNDRSCEEGRRIFEGDPQIRFLADASQVPAADVIFMSGVLQYISDYAGVLNDLTRRFEPALVLLTLMPVGEFATFASAQVNLRGSTMPAWFFNLDELRGLMSGLGYRLVLRSRAELDFDMQDFPASHRLHAMANLVFARTRPAGA